MDTAEYPNVTVGEGYAVAPDLNALGEGYGFRKLRKGLGVTAFGINAITMPTGYETGSHYHDVQEELYFVHKGEIEMEFGDGSTHRLSEGGSARVDASTLRKVRNVGEGDATFVCVGGKDGYVGRDGRMADGEQRVSGPPGAA